MPINNPRGSALLEAPPVMLLLMIFAVGLCLAVYLFFARAWIQYQSEQALHCLSEQNGEWRCKYALEEKINQFLPWGESHAQLHAVNDQWTVEVQWKYSAYSIQLAKTLSPRQILATKALQW